MEPTVLPLMRWIPVAAMVPILFAGAKASPQPRLVLRRGGMIVAALIAFMLLVPFLTLQQFRWVPAILFLMGIGSMAVRYAKRPPTQGRYGSLAAVLEAHRRSDYEGVLRLCDDPGLARFPAAQLELMRGCALFHLRRLGEAEAQLKAALDRPADRRLQALILDQMGQVLLELDRPDEAIFAFHGAEQLDPAHGTAFAGEAEVYLRGKYELEKALELAQRGVEADRKQSAEVQAISLSTSLATLGWALAANGRPAEARESVQEALKQTRPDSVPLLAEDHYLAGRAMLAAGDHAAATEYFRRVWELDPKGNFGFLAQQELTALA